MFYNDARALGAGTCVRATGTDSIARVPQAGRGLINDDERDNRWVGSPRERKRG